MRQSRGLLASNFDREIFHYVLKLGVRASTIEQIDDMLAEFFVVRVWHGSP
jgi:hypothetical protein